MLSKVHFVSIFIPLVRFMLNFIKKHCIYKMCNILYVNVISRVLQRKNLLLLCHGNMSVNLRCGNWAMPKYLLYVTDIYVLLEKKCGEWMSEHMRSYMPLISYGSCVSIDHCSDRLFWKAVMQLVHEEETCCGYFLRFSADEIPEKKKVRRSSRRGTTDKVKKEKKEKKSKEPKVKRQSAPSGGGSLSVRRQRR